MSSPRASAKITGEMSVRSPKRRRVDVRDGDIDSPFWYASRSRSPSRPYGHAQEHRPEPAADIYGYGWPRGVRTGFHSCVPTVPLRPTAV